MLTCVLNLIGGLVLLVLLVACVLLWFLCGYYILHMVVVSVVSCLSLGLRVGCRRGGVWCCSLVVVQWFVS